MQNCVFSEILEEMFIGSVKAVVGCLSQVCVNRLCVYSVLEYSSALVLPSIVAGIDSTTLCPIIWSRVYSMFCTGNARLLWCARSSVFLRFGFVGKSHPDRHYFYSIFFLKVHRLPNPRFFSLLYLFSLKFGHFPPGIVALNFSFSS